MSRIPLIRMTLGLCAVLAAAAVADEPGARPGDDTMTCMQIASELAPYMGQIRAPAAALNQTDSEIVARGKQRVAEETPVVIGITAAATASAADPTGASSRAVGQAEIAHQQQVWSRDAAANKPLADKQAAQSSALLAQAQQMQNDPRLNRLMQLAQQKGCDRQR